VRLPREGAVLGCLQSAATSSASLLQSHQSDTADMIQNMPIRAGGAMVRELIDERQRLAALLKKVRKRLPATCSKLVRMYDSNPTLGEKLAPGH